MSSEIRTDGQTELSGLCWLEHLKAGSDTPMLGHAQGAGLWVSQVRNPLQSGTHVLMSPLRNVRNCSV